jgi:hypothetical protein
MSKLLYAVLACLIIVGAACVTLGRSGCTGTIQKPAAFIDLISPTSLAWGEEVTLTGHGTTSSGTIKAYRWRSTIDGDLGTLPTFTTKTLSPGKHIVLFSAQDSAGNWSLETQGTVNVMTEATGDTGGAADTGDTGGTVPPESDTGGTPAAVPPVVNSFNAVPATIASGSTSTLSWNVSNALAVTISNGVGSVGLAGTRAVSPVADTTYTLTAANTAYFTQATARVTVTAAIVNKPDLIIEDIWNSGNKIYYRVRNQGTAASPLTWSTLKVDGVLRDMDAVRTLAPGASSTPTFGEYSYVCSGASDTVEVTVNTTGTADESNETNNIMTKTLTCATAAPPATDIQKPDLTVGYIKYGEGYYHGSLNPGVLEPRIYCLIRNIGGGSSKPMPFVVKLYINGVEKDRFGLTGAGANYAVAYSFPNYKHKCLPGSPTTARVVVDAEGDVSESNETNNSLTVRWGCPPPTD